MDFSGKNVWITGAGKGIGYATALAFVEAGAKVTGFDQAFTQEQYPFATEVMDVADAAQVAQVCQRLLAETERLDVLVNAAGILRMGATDQLSKEDWQQTFAVNVGGAFNLFIKRFQSVSLLEEYLRSSPYVMDQLKEAKIDELDLHRAIVALSEKMKAVDDNASKKKDEPSLYTSWTLSFTAPTSEEAQKVLAGYIDYISALVVKESIENVRNKLEIKTQFEKEKLAQDRIKTKNQLDANIQRLNYSLDIANAAGIKKPVYSNGQAVKDDPDFSISLGADGIERKLEIEKAVTDVAELNGELRNRQYLVEQLTKANINDVNFTPFKYQLRPSLPVKKDGPGKSIIVILSALIGGMVACGGVLLRHAMASRKQDAMMADHLV